MRIENSNLVLQGSSYSATSVISYQSQEVLGASLIDISDSQNQDRASSRKESAVTISLEASSSIAQSFEMNQSSAVSKTTNAVGSDYSSLPSRDRFRMMVLETLIQRLTGKSSKLSYAGMSATIGYNSNGQGIVQPSNLRLAQRVRSTYTSVTKQDSRISFEAQGTVQTSDGRSISLNLNFNVSQSVEVSTSFVSEVQRRLVDPLVINFSGPLPEFTGDSLSFDLDCDGNEESIAMLSQGSGFLAYDRNGNGKVDDGSELFGPSTNNGYKELAQFDEDGNGWIDENDSIFEKLKIWTPDANENMELVSIKEKGIGALYLGSTRTEMGLYSGSLNAAQLRRTGFVLLESGESRVMQEMDLRV